MSIKFTAYAIKFESWQHFYKENPRIYNKYQKNAKVGRLPLLFNITLKQLGNFRDNHLRLLNLRIYKKKCKLNINLWNFNKLRIFAALKQQSDN